MKNVSMEYRNSILKDREFLYKADIRFTNGKTLHLEDKNDLMADGIKVSAGTSGMDKFDIGAAVMGELVMTLNNSDGKFDTYDFYDAVITLQIGLRTSESTVEYLHMGTYTVDDAQCPGITVVLSALDDLCAFEKLYSKVKTAYPATLYKILSDVCTYCGVHLGMTSFDNGNITIKSRPADDMTCLEVASYIAQISGCYAHIDTSRSLKLDWYKTSIFEAMDSLDGGRFEPHDTGDVADGGNFTNYASGAVIDGGSFIDQRAYAHIYSLGSMDISTDDIVITGIKVIGTPVGEEEESAGHTYGAEGYILEISKNPFVSIAMESNLSAFLGKKIVGMKIRTFSVSALSDPSIDAGDCAYISDRKGNSYPVYITNLSFKLGNYEDFSCGAESPGYKRAAGVSNGTKAIIAARNETQRQLSNYDIAVQRLTSLMSQSFGVFKTEEKQGDGSIIFYMHDKPLLSDSKTIWKMTADSFGVSTDGGKTWKAGFDSSGNAVVNVLNAIGINANWINAGDITLGGTSGNVNGSVTIKDSSGTVIGIWNKNGITINKGAINLGNGAFTVDNTGKATMTDVDITGSGKTYSGYNWKVITSPDGTSPWSGSMEFRVRGNFITAYGSFQLTSGLTSGKSATAIEGIVPQDYRPKSATVRAIAYHGNNPLIFNISTGGNVSVRNAGADDIGSNSTSISFRADYFIF